MQRDPYYFPFVIVTKDELIPGNNYYMKLNDNIIRKSVDARRNVPVSDLKGTFVRLHREIERVTTKEFAVFTNVFIMNQIYKQGLCSSMLIRTPQGFLANDGEGCVNYSDERRNRFINQDREVFLDVQNWKFGIPTEQNILTSKALERISTKLPDDLNTKVLEFQGIKPTGGKIKRRIRKLKKTRKTKKTKKTRKTRKINK